MNNNAKMRTINPSVFVSKYGIIRATDDMLFVGVDVARAFGYGKSNAMINCPLPVSIDWRFGKTTNSKLS